VPFHPLKRHCYPATESAASVRNATVQIQKGGSVMSRTSVGWATILATIGRQPANYWVW